MSDKIKADPAPLFLPPSASSAASPAVQASSIVEQPATLGGDSFDSGPAVGHESFGIQVGNAFTHLINLQEDLKYVYKAKMAPGPYNALKASLSVQSDILNSLDGKSGTPSQRGALDRANQALVSILGSMQTWAKTGPSSKGVSSAAPIDLGPDYLSEGSAGDSVRALQQRLSDLGFDPGPINGDFGAQTQKAVREFQSANHIQVDGIVGPETKEALQPQPL